MWCFIRLTRVCIQQLKNTVGFRKYSKLSYVHNPGKYPFRPLTIGNLLKDAATKYGDRPAIIFRAQKQSLNFQEVLNHADRLAAGLRATGVEFGDRVGIWAPNIVEWYMTMMACGRGGFVLVNINPTYQPQEMEYCINKVGIKTVVCCHKHRSQNYYDLLNIIAPEISRSEPGKIRSSSVPSLRNIVIATEESLRGAYNYQEVLELATESSIKSIRNNQNEIDLDALCHIQFTSGTTGKSKAAKESHFTLVNNGFLIGKRNELDRKHHKICLQVPFFHVFGTDASISPGLNHGATLVIPSPGYNPDKSLDALRDEQCSIIHGTPTMYVDLVNRQKVRQEKINPEIAVSGGAVCSPHLFKEMKEVLKLKKVKSIFGLTETTAFQSMYDDDEFHSTSTVGYVQDHLEAKVINSEGKIVRRGTPGELCVRGYSVFLGYWNDEERTKEAITPDNWLKTGDLFVLEENGYGRILGRKKEMIIRGGENIFPREIEDFLNTHPNILESHVIGVPHERLGEEVCACIRVEEAGVFLTLDDIKAYCKGKISYFKVPSILKVVDSFPKTASGKVQKYKLIESVTKNK